MGGVQFWQLTLANVNTFKLYFFELLAPLFAASNQGFLDVEHNSRKISRETEVSFRLQV